MHGLQTTTITKTCMNGGYAGDQYKYPFSGFLEEDGDPVISGDGSAKLTSSGFLGGVQAGYNYQFATSWVGGVEADIDATSITGKVSLGASAVYEDVPVSGSASAKSEQTYLGTARLRLGYLITAAIPRVRDRRSGLRSGQNLGERRLQLWRRWRSVLLVEEHRLIPAGPPARASNTRSTPTGASKPSTCTSISAPRRFSTAATRRRRRRLRLRLEGSSDRQYRSRRPELHLQLRSRGVVAPPFRPDDAANAKRIGELGLSAGLSSFWAYRSGAALAPRPSERCIITESVQWPNL